MNTWIKNGGLVSEEDARREEVLNSDIECDLGSKGTDIPEVYSELEAGPAWNKGYAVYDGPDLGCLRKARVGYRESEYSREKNSNR